MSERIDQARRTALRLTGLVVAGIAGCATDDSSDETGTQQGDGTDVEPAAGTSTTATLDLREANVTAVEVEQRDESVRFSVTLYHDDDGEDRYANWWQVESLDGERFGRRKLLHAHSTDPFTRSETVDISDGTACVVVRGHDQTHGYGGQAMLVDSDSGETRAINQGSESRSFSEAECP